MIRKQTHSEYLRTLIILMVDYMASIDWLPIWQDIEKMNARRYGLDEFHVSFEELREKTFKNF